MLDKNKWVESFKGLEPNDQLQISKIIKSELIDNEEFMDDGEYNKKKSTLIRKAITSMINNIKKKEELKNLSKTFKNFNRLSEDKKEKAIYEIAEVINKYNEIQRQDNKEATCAREGHIFSNWRKEIKTMQNIVWLSGQSRNMTFKHAEWNRTCNRCGCTQTVNEEPLEAKEARIAKYNERQEKSLRRQLV